MRTSDSLSKISPALLKAQQTITNVMKGSDNPYFKSKYADLNAVMETVKGPLNDNGIVILQFPDEAMRESTIALTTRLQHTSGEFIEATANVPIAKTDPQAFGAAVTYARRYSLQAAIGLLAEDDDAESAVRHEPRPATKQGQGSGKKASLFPRK